MDAMISEARRNIAERAAKKQKIDNVASELHQLRMAEIEQIVRDVVQQQLHSVVAAVREVVSAVDDVVTAVNEVARGQVSMRASDWPAMTDEVLESQVAAALPDESGSSTTAADTD